MICPYCDNQIPATANNCPCCGAAVTPQQAPQVVVMQQAAPQTPPKSRITYILLGLFLGSLGIHNFYAGRTGAGVAQLLITLLIGWTVIPLVIVSIWVLIELIAVSTDGKGVRMN